jgi:hypothetical protein
VCAITGRKNVKSGKKIGEIVKNIGKFLYLYGGNLRNQKTRPNYYKDFL